MGHEIIGYPFYCPTCEEGWDIRRLLRLDFQGSRARPRQVDGVTVYPTRYKDRGTTHLRQAFEEAQHVLLTEQVASDVCSQLGIPSTLSDPLRIYGFAPHMGAVPDLQRWSAQLQAHVPFRLFGVRLLHVPRFRRVPALILPIGLFPGQILGFFVLNTVQSFCLLRSTVRQWPPQLAFHAFYHPDRPVRRYLKLIDALQTVAEQGCLGLPEFGVCWQFSLSSILDPLDQSAPCQHQSAPTPAPSVDMPALRTTDNYRQS